MTYETVSIDDLRKAEQTAKDLQVMLAEMQASTKGTEDQYGYSTAGHNFAELATKASDIRETLYHILERKTREGK